MGGVADFAEVVDKIVECGLGFGVFFLVSRDADAPLTVLFDHLVQLTDPVLDDDFDPLLLLLRTLPLAIDREASSERSIANSP